jgi:fucose permease
VPAGSSFVARSSSTPVPVGGRLPRPYWIAWSLMGLTGAVEVSLSLWAAEVLRTHAGMSAGGASAAVGSIVGGMLVGRLVGGRIALRAPPAALLVAALGLSTAGFIVFWLATAPWLAITGLILLGLGNAMHYPLAISMAVAAAGGQPDRAAAYSSYSVALGFGLGPLVLGWVADGLGSAHVAFLVVPVMLAAAVVLALWLGRSLAAEPATPALPVAASSRRAATGE